MLKHFFRIIFISGRDDKSLKRVMRYFTRATITMRVNCAKMKYLHFYDRFHKLFSSCTNVEFAMKQHINDEYILNSKSKSEIYFF